MAEKDPDPSVIAQMLLQRQRAPHQQLAISNPVNRIIAVGLTVMFHFSDTLRIAWGSPEITLVRFGVVVGLLGVVFPLFWFLQTERLRRAIGIVEEQISRRYRSTYDGKEDEWEDRYISVRFHKSYGVRFLSIERMEPIFWSVFCLYSVALAQVW